MHRSLLSVVIFTFTPARLGRWFAVLVILFGITGIATASSFILSKIFLPPAQSDLFGFSVDAVGNNVLIGAPDDSSQANHSGVAFLFDATTEGLVRTFLNPTPEADDTFGWSVAIGNGNVLIGAPLARTPEISPTPGAFQTGEAYLFDAVTGVLLETFVNPAPSNGYRFGDKVAFIGNNILITAPGVSDPGAVYLFDPVTGALLKTFQSPTPNSNDIFGGSLAVSGNKVLIGAFNDDTVGTTAGAAYLFDTTTDALLRTFLNPASSLGLDPTNDHFGRSVAFVGDNVLIGAYNADLGAEFAGAAYLFDTGTGALLQTFQDPTPDVSDDFGWSVSSVGTDVLIGNRVDDTLGSNVGAAYLFDAVTGTLLQTIPNPDPVANDRFGHTLTSDGDNLLIGAPFVTRRFPGGAVYLFTLSDEVDAIPPVITVAASPATLWPPDGRLVTVTVSGTITDESNGSGVSSAAYQVMDEYGQIHPSGSVIPEADGSYAFTVALQASRRGNDQNGRHYTIKVSATDNAGNLGDASATVTVPRN